MSIELKKEIKYYTAFALAMEDTLTHQKKLYHCTHKYLGEQSLSNMRMVMKICDEFFETVQTFPHAIFTEFDYFGVVPIPVLKSRIHVENFFLDLRMVLDGFYKDDYSEYQPHISDPSFVAGSEIIGTFQCYAIMSGQDTIHKYWENTRCRVSRR